MLVLPLAGDNDATPEPTLEALAHVALELSVASNVVVGVGAGISTAAGIPDFRGSSGVYSTKLRRSPTSSHSSLPGPSSSSSFAPSASPTPTPDPPLPPIPHHGPQKAKALFSYAALLHPSTRAEHLQLMAALHDRARAIRKGKAKAKEHGEGETPTAFHALLKRLEEGGRLRRVWSQNVDGLEAAAGLGMVDLLAGAEGGAFAGKGKGREVEPLDAGESSSSDWEASTRRLSRSRRKRRRLSRSLATTAAAPPFPLAASAGEKSGTVVALHGSLSEVVCTVCGWRERWKKRHSKAFREGEGVDCSKCAERARTRQRASKRIAAAPSRSFLRPAVILYDDPSSFALSTSSSVLSLLDSDLAPASHPHTGKKPLDFLLVAGTSLKIPGFKSVVRECARAVKDEGGLCVMVNREVVGKEWEGVFDYLFLGDTDEFACHVQSFLAAFTSPSSAEPAVNSPLPTPAASPPAVDFPPLPPAESSSLPAKRPRKRPRFSSPAEAAPPPAARLPTPPPSSSPAPSPARDLPSSPARAPSPVRHRPVQLVALPSPPPFQPLPQPRARPRPPPPAPPPPPKLDDLSTLSSPARRALGPLFSLEPLHPAPEAPRTKHRIRSVAAVAPGSVWLQSSGGGGGSGASTPRLGAEGEAVVEMGDVMRTLRKAEKKARREERKREREREEKRARKEERRRRRAERRAARGEVVET
ncbi:hypothetical protein JCM6882_009321 [Rhodosporidiobolus microsporus]